MKTGFQLSPFPEFQPGETLLHFKKRIWLVSGKSLPSYRIAFGLPPLMDFALYLTNRRVLFAGHFLGVFNQLFSVWFRSGATGDRGEILRGSRTGMGRIGGRYLELQTYDPETHWYRSHEARIRFYTRDAEPLERLICQQAATPSN